MAKRPLKRSLEYQARVRLYAAGLAERYRMEVVEAFLSRIEVAERFITSPGPTHRICSLASKWY